MYEWNLNKNGPIELHVWILSLGWGVWWKGLGVPLWALSSPKIGAIPSVLPLPPAYTLRYELSAVLAAVLSSTIMNSSPMKA